MTLRISSVDNWPGFQLEELGPARYLVSKYGAVVSQEEPDIVFCDIFHLGQPQRKDPKYKHALKILCSGENILRKPIDWEDFVLVFSCNFFPEQAKFLHVPFPILAGRAELFEKRILSSERPRFMNFVASNFLPQFEGCALRDQLFQALEKEFGSVKVHSAGKHLNNCPEKAPKTSEQYPSLNVDPAWLAQYQFTICGENQLVEGYYTEKPIQAWIAGSIPVYLTSVSNLRWLNDKAGIFGHSIEDIPQMVERIKNLQPAEIELMRQEPLFRYSPAKLQKRMERRLDRMMAVWLTLKGKISIPKEITTKITLSEVCWNGESGAVKLGAVLIQNATVTPAAAEIRGIPWNLENVRAFRFQENCRFALNTWPISQEVVLLTKGPAKFHPQFKEELIKLLDLKWSTCLLSYSLRSWQGSQWSNSSQTAFHLAANMILTSFALLVRRESLFDLCSSSGLLDWNSVFKICSEKPYILSYPPLMMQIGSEEEFFKQFKVNYQS